MTNLEFTGPGLNPDQWERINALAVSLAPGQALWLSGYFAGLDYRMRTGTAPVATPAETGTPLPSATSAAARRSLTILFGSETGNSAGLARRLGEMAQQAGLPATVVDMANYKAHKLRQEQDLLIITSTHGEGDPPASAAAFFEFIESRKAPRLEDVRYAVLALGDSTYEHYCGAGKRLDQRLGELGAAQLRPRTDCDVDYDDAAAAWIESVLGIVAPAEPAPAAVPASPRAAEPAPGINLFDKRHPFQATILDNVVLTGRGSTKETRHIELSLAESGLAFEPGDALGIVPANDPALADTVLSLLALGGDEPVTIKDVSRPLRQALIEDVEITAATPRFLDLWSETSDAAELRALQGSEQHDARSAFLRSHHIIDIIRRFPVTGVDPQGLISGLRPLQPRLYSIASSQAQLPDEVHLTVTTLRYDLLGETRTGVASGHLARCDADRQVPVYVQTNPHFRLPEDDAPIIMIGAGTGVAPYRAFLQHREEAGSAGKSWLFFGERNFRSDFLYQIEWQGWLRDGVLSRMNVAFSRDRAEKTYVQHRLLEHSRDIYGWLQEGAHVYVCGDGTHLAPDVHAALAGVIQQEGGLSREAAMEELAAMQRDHRYQIDAY